MADYLVRVRYGMILGLLLASNPACRRSTTAPPQTRPTIVTVSQPVQQDVTDFVDFTARTEAIESVDVRPRVSGYLDKILFTSGSDIKKGDLLFEIDRRPYKAALDLALANLKVAEVTLHQAGIEFARLDDLLKAESATQLEWDRQASLKAASEAQVAAAQASVEEAQLNYDWTLVHAPISGRISRNYVDAGNLVQSGTLLTSIVNSNPIYAYMDVDERTMLTYQKAVREGKLKSARAGENHVPVFMGLALDKGFPHTGRIDFAENKVDPNTGTVRVRAEFPNPDSIIAPGLFARVRLPLGEPAPALLVSERAIGVDQGQRFLFVVNAKNVVEYRTIEVGPLNDGLRVIANGIKADEWVIVNGLQRVRPGVTVDPQKIDMRGLTQATTTQVAASPAATQPASP